jgi:hypothetical protein
MELKQSQRHLLDDGMRQAEGMGNHHARSTVDNMLDAVEGHGPGNASDPEVGHKVVERQSTSSHALGGLLDNGVRQTEGTDDRFSTVDNMLRAVEGNLLDDGVRQTEGTDDRLNTVDNMLRSVEGKGPGKIKKRRRKKKSVTPKLEAVAPSPSPSARHASELKAEPPPPLVQKHDLC